MVDVSRVQKELTKCNCDREVSGVSIALHDGASISHLTGTIAGPKDTPYEGGTFVIDLRLPKIVAIGRTMSSLWMTSTILLHPCTLLQLTWDGCRTTKEGQLKKRLDTIFILVDTSMQRTGVLFFRERSHEFIVQAYLGGPENVNLQETGLFWNQFLEALKHYQDPKNYTSAFINTFLCS